LVLPQECVGLPTSFFIEFTPMFNDLTTTDHACITPRRIDSASALPGSAVEWHLIVGRGRHFMGRSTRVGHGRGRRQAAACPSCRRRRSQSTPRCRGGDRSPELCDRHLEWSGRAHTWGPDSQAAARSGGQPGDDEVGRTAGRRAVGHTRGGQTAGQR
jgi:hypothetical protein